MNKVEIEGRFVNLNLERFGPKEVYTMELLVDDEIVVVQRINESLPKLKDGQKVSIKGRVVSNKWHDRFFTNVQVDLLQAEENGVMSDEEKKGEFLDEPDVMEVDNDMADKVGDQFHWRKNPTKEQKKIIDAEKEQDLLDEIPF